MLKRNTHQKPICWFTQRLYLSLFLHIDPNFDIFVVKWHTLKLICFGIIHLVHTQNFPQN